MKHRSNVYLLSPVTLVNSKMMPGTAEGEMGALFDLVSCLGARDI